MAGNAGKLLRCKRICGAFNDKCPKLEKFRSKGHISVLALESNDLFLANYFAIAEIAGDELIRRNNSPDEVYLFETEMDPWVLVIIKKGDCVFPEIPDGGPYELFSAAVQRAVPQ